MSQFNLLIVDNNESELARWRAAGDRVGGFTIIQALSVEEAMDVVNSRTVDVLVTDMFLTAESELAEEPNQAEGCQLIEYCRAMHRRSRIVAITGISGIATPVGARALEAGADFFVSSGWRRIDTDHLLEQELRVFLTLLREAPRVTLS